MQNKIKICYHLLLFAANCLYPRAVPAAAAQWVPPSVAIFLRDPPSTRVRTATEPAFTAQEEPEEPDSEEFHCHRKTLPHSVWEPGQTSSPNCPQSFRRGTSKWKIKIINTIKLLIRQSATDLYESNVYMTWKLSQNHKILLLDYQTAKSKTKKKS